ncbi:hypothetical protein BDW22DRAFT_1314395, partial [Trametopsis cervina]
NHKRDFCSDGVRTIFKNSAETPPPWPQPAGIFSRGVFFHPIIFITKLKALVEALHALGPTQNDLDLESQALWTMFKARTVVCEGTGAILFNLFDTFTLTPQVPELLVQY